MSEQRDIDAETPFYVADWHVDPATCRITKGEQLYKIEPKAMTVLVCLAQKQGQVISREALEEKAWQGMVVGYDSLASAIIKLRKAFGDNAKNPDIIETVPKKGYRLICPVSSTPPAHSLDIKEAQHVDNSSKTDVPVEHSSTCFASNSAALGKPLIGIVLAVLTVTAFFYLFSIYCLGNFTCFLSIAH